LLGTNLTFSIAVGRLNALHLRTEDKRHVAQYHTRVMVSFQYSTNV
jgi:hypothetical protein